MSDSKLGRPFGSVPDEWIGFAYSLTAEKVHTSGALTTVELAADGGGTRLILTEQVVFLDGVDGTASRPRGWGGGCYPKNSGRPRASPFAR